MVDFLVKAENKEVFDPQVSKEKMSRRERQHIRDGDWGEVSITDSNVIEQARKGHCRRNDAGEVVVKPESEWHENTKVRE